jgi:predicted CXXCH cytochrome family protein
MSLRRARTMTTPGWNARRLLVMLALFVTVVVGCSIETRYKLKTIVFTGVPPLHEEQTADGEAQVDPQQSARNEQQARQKRHREALISRYWQHGPFAAGECGRCHSLGQSTSFLGNRDATNQPPQAVTVSASSRLSLSKEKLCVTCHTQHGAAFVQNLDLEHHQPAADGACTGCHNPHQSLRRYMLHKADNVELCGDCHNPESLTPVHTASPGQDCVACHNAHVGITSKLLKSDAGELTLLYGGDNRD